MYRVEIDSHLLKFAEACLGVTFASLKISFLVVLNLVRSVDNQFLRRLGGQPPCLDDRRSCLTNLTDGEFRVLVKQ